MDNNENGTFDAGDMGIANVTVELYASTDNPGVDAPLATDITDPSGYYYFDELDAGQYIVYIPASNFAAGQVLENKETYPGADAGDVDNNDNGEDTPVNGGISSGVVDLQPNSEPTNESGAGGIASATPQYPGTLDDDNVNETVDFTFRVGPIISHDKVGPVISVQQTDGSYNITYTVTVANTGDAAGNYTLIDTPDFDDDITINSAYYEWVIQPSGGTFANSLAGSGPWTLANNQIIGAGGLHTYTLVVNVTLDLSDGGADGGDETYTACGETVSTANPEPGEGLYNMTTLDTDGDGDPEEEDEVCGDLPYITHHKDMVMVTGPNADGTYTAMYTVEVMNLGGAAGTYDLVDTPNFDDDITIVSADYTTTNVVPSVAGGALSFINGNPNT